MNGDALESSPEQPPQHGDLSALRPSAGLLTAALVGLMAFSITGCDEDENGNPLCGPTGATGNVPTTPTPSTMDGGAHTTPPTTADASVEVQPDVPGFRSLSSLRAECDGLGGYMQVHAACAGSNMCKGFAYHSGTPGKHTEHTCASANGCTGASCVVLPPDRGRSGKEVYEFDDMPEFGPANCTNCHAVWGEKDAMGNYPPPDTTKFKVWVMPGSTRNASNWLQMSAAQQEAIVAFGKTDFFADGTPQVSMRGYHKLLSREEIKKVVAHIRTLQPLIETIKVPAETP